MSRIDGGLIPKMTKDVVASRLLLVELKVTDDLVA